jgi:hypothetical protein
MNKNRTDLELITSLVSKGTRILDVGLWKWRVTTILKR